MGPFQVLSLRVRVDLGVIAMKGNFTLSKSPELETHHKIEFGIIPTNDSEWEKEKEKE